MLCPPGDFSEGLCHGSGTLVRADGSSHVGSWVEGKRSGPGTETLPNGDVFEGNFHDDAREGQGILRTAGGIARSGIWAGGRLRGGRYLEIRFREGHVYCGDNVDAIPHGE